MTVTEHPILPGTATASSAPTSLNPGRMTLEAWKAEAAERFGADTMKWKFVCPSCGHVAAVQDWHDVGAPEGSVAFSCVGRFQKDQDAAAAAAFRHAGGPCNYTSGGLFVINRLFVEVEGKSIPAFEVAPADTTADLATTKDEEA